MTTDRAPEALLVERLRTDVLWHKRRHNETIAADCQEAAETIERLTAERDALRNALQSCIDYGAMTGAEWVAEKARAALAAAPAPASVLAYMAVNREGEARFTDNAKAAEELEHYGWAITPLSQAPAPAPAPQPFEWPKLTKPAKVGGGTFRVGVSARLVVEAAQRQHEYAEAEGRRTPEEWQQVERARRELWDMLNGAPAPHPDTADAERWRHVLRSVYFVRQGEYVLRPGRPNTGRDDSIGRQWLRRDVDAAIDAARARAQKG